MMLDLRCKLSGINLENVYVIYHHHIRSNCLSKIAVYSNAWPVNNAENETLNMFKPFQTVGSSVFPKCFVTQTHTFLGCKKKISPLIIIINYPRIIPFLGGYPTMFAVIMTIFVGSNRSNPQNQQMEMDCAPLTNPPPRRHGRRIRRRIRTAAHALHGGEEVQGMAPGCTCLGGW
jgi:hypothetical protein